MLDHRRAIIGCLLLIPVIVSAGKPYNYGFDVRGSLAKRQNTSDWILVTNLQNGTENGTPARVEIRELKKDRHKWDLYLLALSMFHWSHPDTPDSWYQIAGMALLSRYPLLSRPLTCNLLVGRHSWISICALEWSPGGELHERVLPTCIHPLSKLASALSCTYRGE
ncbi:hypothetical protein VUR80DRAFT_1975 [Thermomyces stellatus]